jgi:uncharacterized protein involved in exopolysaccharide biosynthesis
MEMGNIQKEALTHNNGKGKPLQSVPLIYQAKLPENEPDELNLRQLLGMIRRRALVIAGVSIAVTSAIAFWTMNQTPRYEGKFQLLVEPVTEQGNLDNLTQILGSQNNQSSRKSSSSLDYDTQIQVLRSPNLMSPIIEEIEKRYKDVNYDSLLGSNQLTISQLEETKILEVRYRDTDPKKVQFVLHQVARGYLRYSLRERQTNLRQGIQFVDSQLPQLRARVDKLQGELQAFRQQNNLLDPESQANSWLIVLARLRESNWVLR